MSNIEKAIRIAKDREGLTEAERDSLTYEDGRFNGALAMAVYKDKQVPRLLKFFALYLERRGAFRADLCMDYEHEAKTFFDKIRQ